MKRDKRNRGDSQNHRGDRETISLGSPRFQTGMKKAGRVKEKEEGVVRGQKRKV